MVKLSYCNTFMTSVGVFYHSVDWHSGEIWVNRSFARGILIVPFSVLRNFLFLATNLGILNFLFRTALM